MLNDIGPEIQGGGLVLILNCIGDDAPEPDWGTAIAHLKVLFSHVPLGTPAKWRRFAEATFREGDDGLLHVNRNPALAKPLRRSHRTAPDFTGGRSARGVHFRSRLCVESCPISLRRIGSSAWAASIPA